MSKRALGALSTAGSVDTPLPSKLYFRIGEVAGMVGVEPHVLRYWEREFRAIRPTKSSKGQRVYSRKDVENLLRVRALLYEEGFTIAGAKKQLGRPNGAPSVGAAGSEERPTAAPPATQAAARPSAPAEARARESIQDDRRADLEPTSEITSSPMPAHAEVPMTLRARDLGSSPRAPTPSPPSPPQWGTPAPPRAFSPAAPPALPAPRLPTPAMTAVRASLYELRAELELLLDELDGE